MASADSSSTPAPGTLGRFLGKVSEEIGWHSIYHSSWDTKILCAQRFVRMFAYGSSTLVLALFLSGIGITTARIGLFMTLTLLGDVLLSSFLTLIADKVGRRKILTGGAVLMILSGTCFSISSHYWVLVIASVFGVISPSGNEIGPFRAIEESTLAHLSAKDRRSDIYAWYNLIGSAGAAIGTLSAGGIVQSLQSHHGWNKVDSYRAIFVLYSCIGLLKTILTLTLSSACELEPVIVEAEYQPILNGEAHAADNVADVEGDENNPKTPAIKSTIFTRFIRLFPQLTPASRSILVKLCLLFAIDSFASGLVPASWVTYFFNTKFNLQASVLGTIFFVANIFASASGLAASSMAKRIGNIKTMVFTHLPSSIFLAMIPLPADVGLAATLLFLRSATSSMDQAPRQAFLSAAVLSSERTAVMGIVNVVKTFSQSGGPTVTGLLAGGRFWLVFLMAGCLKASYDVAMLAMFLGHREREEDE